MEAEQTDSTTYFAVFDKSSTDDFEQHGLRKYNRRSLHGARQLQLIRKCGNVLNVDVYGEA